MNPKTIAITAAVAAAIIAGTFVLAPDEALADRTDVWSAASVDVHKVDLAKLSDGGCSVQAHAFMTKQDGGIASESSRPVEVGGANRTTCLDVLNTRGPALFKADKDLQ